jgi:hypothetical protein
MGRKAELSNGVSGAIHALRRDELPAPLPNRQLRNPHLSRHSRVRLALSTGEDHLCPTLQGSRKLWPPRPTL